MCPTTCSARNGYWPGGSPWRKSELLWKTTKQDLLVLAQLLESGGVTPVTERTHLLSDTAAAIAYVVTMHARGSSSSRCERVCAVKWSPTR